MGRVKVLYVRADSGLVQRVERFAAAVRLRSGGRESEAMVVRRLLRAALESEGVRRAVGGDPDPQSDR